MEKVPKFGLMELDMKGFGERTKLMAKESSGMLMGTSSKGSGKTIKPTVMESTLI